MQWAMGRDAEMRRAMDDGAEAKKGLYFGVTDAATDGCALVTEDRSLYVNTTCLYLPST
jgi:hypothetical protein